MVAGYNRGWEGNLPTIGQRWQQRDDRAATVSWTHSFRPNLLNEFRSGFGLNNNPINFDLSLGSTQHGLDIVKELGLGGAGARPAGHQRNSEHDIQQRHDGSESISLAKKGYRTHSEELQDQLSWFRGKPHAEIRNQRAARRVRRVRRQYKSLRQRAILRPVHRASLTLISCWAFRRPPSRAFPPVEVDRNRWSYDFFAADDIKLSPKLTLNLGVRYELHLNWRENNNLMSLFDIEVGQAS